MKLRTIPWSYYLPVVDLVFKGSDLHSTEFPFANLFCSMLAALKQVYKSLLRYQILSTYFSKDNIRETRFFKKQRSFTCPNSPCVCWIYLKDKKIPFNWRMSVAKAEVRNETPRVSRSKGVLRACVTSQQRIYKSLAQQWGKEREKSRGRGNCTWFLEFLLRTYLFVISVV